MPTERLIFTLVSVPVLLLALFFFCTSPYLAVQALRSSQNAQVRVAAKWLLAAWLVFAALIAAYFLSGWWYRENIIIRPVDPLEVFCLLMLLVFGIHLPSVGYGRLRKARKKALAAESP
jgi:glucan phosphoethanolaminetransferase (alkaline phosphatase superfamily)